MDIKGQNKLLSIIDSFNMDTLPRTIMLIGKYGSGKHLICDHIAKKLNLDLINISYKNCYSTIQEITLSSTPAVYSIDCTAISDKDQYSLLKFLEEPLKNAYIVLLVNNKYSILPTILNRCYQLTLAPYDKEILSEFIGDNENKQLILDIAETPGEIALIKGENISKTVNLADKIIMCISKAGFANSLSLIDKVAYRTKKNDTTEKTEDKVDVFLLCKMILHRLAEIIRTDSNLWYITAYNLTLELDNKLNMSLNIAGIDQKFLFAQYISDMWNKSRGD